MTVEEKEVSGMGRIDDMVQIQNYLLALKEVDTDNLLRQAEEAMQGMLVGKYF